MPRHCLLRSTVLLGALALGAPGPSADAQQGDWQRVEREDGVTIWELDVAGEQVPGFRGVTTIEASPEAIYEVIDDVDSHPEWMYRCAEARVLEKKGPDRAVVYNRTDTPWPARDRDVVLETWVERKADGTIVAHFEDTDPERVPVPRRTVRMPRLRGSYELSPTGDGQTRVTYTVEADIGGRLPDFIAENVAQGMPLHTLTRLRERVE